MMRWPWSKPKRTMLTGVTVLDVRGAQLIILRSEERLPPPVLETMRERLRVALAGTALEGVQILVLSRGTDLSVFVA